MNFTGRFGYLVLAVWLGCLGNAFATQSLVIETSDAGKKQVYSSSRALIIGNSNYRFWNKLPSVPDELNLLKATLVKQGFSDGDVQVEKDLGGEDLGKKIRSFLYRETSTDTRLIVFFAGHGWSNESSTGYIVPVDAPKPGKQGFRESIVSMQDVLNWSYESKAKHILFIFDSCFSGSIFLTRSNLMPSKLYIADADRDVRQIITSGSDTEEVPASSKFVKKLAEGLEGAADILKDGVITGNELGFWLKQVVSEEGEQTPQFGSSTVQRFRGGDTLFLAASPLMPATAKPLYKAILAEGSRGANTRLIGTPSGKGMEVFKGIAVYYYQKLADGESVWKAMEREKLPFVRTRASLSQQYKSNAIACGPDTPAEAIKVLAKTLIASGINVQAIMPFQNDAKSKHNRMEILTTLIRQGPGLRDFSEKGLSETQIDQLTECPKLR